MSLPRQPPLEKTLPRKYRDFRRSWAKFCCYCGVKLCQEHRKADGSQCGDEATWDHVVPGQNGKGVMGRHKVVACYDCNQDRGNKTIPGWFSSIKQRFSQGSIKDHYIEKAARVVGREE